MFGFSFLTAAWWAAKAVLFKDTAARFINESTWKALAVVVGGVVALIVVIFSINVIRSGAADGAVASLQSKLMASRVASVLRERKAVREAEERAAVERQSVVERLREASDHAVSLEQQLARLTENPVCFPANISKELRK